MTIILIIILAGISQMFLPWWSCVIVAFAVSAFTSKKAFEAFVSGFLGIFILWLAMATLIHFRNDFLLSERIAAMLSLPTSHLLPLISGLVGGIAGGIGAWSGKFTGDLLRNI